MVQLGKHRGCSFKFLEKSIILSANEHVLCSVTFSDFLINDYCGMLDETFATMVSLGILDEIDGQCFRVHAVAKTGSWFLISAAVLLAIQNHFVRMAAKQQTEELEATANMSQYTDVESKINSAHEFSPRSSVDFTDYYRLALNISYVHVDLPKEDSPQSNVTEQFREDSPKVDPSEAEC